MIMNTSYTLNFYKCRDVKSPEKFGKAAGWDFFIPNDLCINDFVSNAKCYYNEYIDVTLDNEGYYKLLMVFYVNYKDTEYPYFLYLKKNPDETFNYKVVNYSNYVLHQQIEVPVEELKAIINKPVNRIKLTMGAKVLIPSGIHVKLPNNVFLVAENKSGIASKRGLTVGASVIDQDYTGQVHINLINSCITNTYIKPGEKIIQFVPYFQPNMFERKEYSSKDELYKDVNSERGEGGFGSTGV